MANKTIGTRASVIASNRRTRFLIRRVILASLTASALYMPAGMGQDYPTRAVTMITTFQAGAIGDILARTISKGLTTTLKQSVIVENKVGAGGVIATAAVANAKPDGYTLLLGSSGTVLVHPFIYDKLPYDAAKGFAPVTQIASLYSMLVVPASLPVKSVAELIAIAKANPGKLTFGSGGNGTTPHLAGELFKTMAGNLNITHVPYKGSVQSSLDLIEGRISMIFANVPSVLPHIQTGKLRVLAVTTANRVAEFPNIPTIWEAGVPGYASELWMGIFAPPGTPAPIVERLNKDIRNILSDAEFIRTNAAKGVIIETSNPDQFNKYIQEELVKWEKIVKTSGAKPE